MTENLLHIRWLIRRDMEEVLYIENESFPQPWSEEDFLRCLRQRNCIGMVCENGDQVVGFMIYELHKAKLAILNFSVHPEHRRYGVGRKMMSKLQSKLSAERRNRIVADITETNLDGQLFLRDMGFRAIDILKGHFDDGSDAYKMVHRYGEVI